MPQKGREHFNLTGFKWLHFDGESQLMSCDWCKKFGKDNPDGKFVKGTDNFKRHLRLPQWK
jgi:hypothetical protein